MKKSVRLALVLACVAAMAFFAGCAAKKHKTPTTADEFFGMYDADNSGEVTEEEFVAKFKDKEKAHKAFQMFDPENDGRVQRSAASLLESNASLWNQVDMDDSTALEP